MYVIATGNAFDGITLYCDNDGLPFHNHNDAVEAVVYCFIIFSCGL